MAGLGKWMGERRTDCIGAVASRLRQAWAPCSGDAGGVWIRAARKARFASEALHHVLRSSAAGHPAGHFELGLAHWEGLLGGEAEGLAKGEAVACFLRAAELGHGGAMMMLGEATRLGTGVARNLPKAFDWYSAAARAGNLRAARVLAQAYEQGESVAQDVVKAAVWRELSGPGPVPGLPRSCAAGLPEISRESPIGILAPGGADSPWECTRDGSPRSFSERITEHLGQAALYTGAGILALLGLVLLVANVYGFVRWFKTGELMFSLSAFPMFILPAVGISAWALWRGKDVDRRARRGSTQLLRRAESGDAEACCQLGLAFLEGDSEHPKDSGSARRWLRRSAELGNLEGAVKLAGMLSWGAGGPKDLDGATAWLRRAAEGGNLEAMGILRTLAPDRTLAPGDLLALWSGSLRRV